METRICSICNIEKPITDYYSFIRNGTNKKQYMYSCKKCTNIKNILDRKKHAETRKKARHNYYLKNKDAILANTNKYKNEHKELIKKQGQKYYIKNMDVIKKKTYDKNLLNPQKNRDRVKQYRKTPNGKASRRLSNHIRRSIIHESITQEAKEYIKNIFTSDNNICYWCGKTINKKDVSIDHIIPLSKGGLNTIDNLVSAHKSCNSSKNNKLPWEFVKHRLVTGQSLAKKFLVNDGVAQATLF